jgi:imidazolonepropionase-like amidohydrolase
MLAGRRRLMRIDRHLDRGDELMASIREDLRLHRAELRLTREEVRLNREAYERHFELSRREHRATQAALGAAFNAAVLVRNGVITSINSDSGELIRHLYHEAAKSQRYGGLTDEEALALITINPAKQLGIDQYVGSIEEGKQADLVIFNNHPLSVYAVPQMTFVDGRVYFDIEDDQDDQRLKVDPNETVEAIYLKEHHHNCMQNVDFYFTNFGRNLFEHQH